MGDLHGGDGLRSLYLKAGDRQVMELIPSATTLDSSLTVTGDLSVSGMLHAGHLRKQVVLIQGRSSRRGKIFLRESPRLSDAGPTGRPPRASLRTTS